LFGAKAADQNALGGTPALPILPAMRLAPTTQTLHIGLLVEYYEDASGQLTLADMLSPKAPLFLSSKQEQLSFGFSRSAYWVRFSLQNMAPKVNDWLLEIPYPPLDVVEYSWFDGTRWQTRRYGDLQPFGEREVFHRHIVVPLNVPDSLPRQFFLRIHTQSSVQIPLIVGRTHALYREHLMEEITYGLFYGGLLVMIFYNLFIVLSLRSPTYVYYVAYIAAVTLYYLALNGHGYQYVWSWSPWFANTVHPFALGCATTGLALFTMSFLDAKHYVSWLALLLRALVVVGLGIVLGGFVVPYRVMVVVAALVALVLVVAALAGGVIAWRRGHRAARYFVVAMAVFVLGAAAFSLKTLGVLPANVLTNRAMELGSLLEVVLLSFALADRYRTLRLEKEAAQAESLRLQAEINETLEQKVHLRTQELEASTHEIVRQMEILDEQANEIEIANSALQERNMALATLNEEKNQLLGIVAHDLKNPLTTIIMNASMVRSYKDRISMEQMQHLAERIEVTAGRMHEIILKLLDAKAIEEGKLVLRCEDIPVEPLLKELAEEYSKRAAQKNIRLHIVCSAPNATLFADRHCLMEVLENLLSNAIKFSPTGKQVWLKLVDGDAPDSPQQPSVPRTTLAVQDEGPGLSDEDKKQLFGKFARLSAQPTGGEHSTGLGLSIVKAMVEAMDGSVWCESTVGNGATFYVALPQQRSTITSPTP
jgi:signal transduction histidine kinase